MIGTGMSFNEPVINHHPPGATGEPRPGRRQSHQGLSCELAGGFLNVSGEIRIRS